MAEDDNYDRKAAVAALIELENKAITAAVREAEASIAEQEPMLVTLSPTGPSVDDVTDGPSAIHPVGEVVTITTEDGTKVEEVVSPNVMALLLHQEKRINDLEVMNEAQRALTVKAEAEVEFQQACDRERRADLEQTSHYRLWAIDALIEALLPFARFATEANSKQGMTEPVCLSVAAVQRADALVKLHQALR